MAFEHICVPLQGDSPGRVTEFNYFRIGPADSDRKAYLQAALHADEQPGILVLHHLLALLKEADQQGQLDAQFVLMPMVNPLGMGDIEFGSHQGRYNRSTGVNHNRRWPDLLTELDHDFSGELGNDATANIKLVRQQLRQWAKSLPEVTAEQQWRKIIIREACDADYVFDLHCDDDSMMHIFSVPQQHDVMHRLANRIGSAATMLAADSGGGSFDEVWPAIWIKLADQFPDAALPMPLASATLEYRGQIDTFDDLNRADAKNLFAFFQDEGMIDGDAPTCYSNMPAPTDLRATEYLRVDKPGLLIYRVALGDQVEQGEVVAELLTLDGEGAFVDREPIVAGTAGLVLSRATTKYVWSGAQVAKIVGSEILESRQGNLLSD